tara:strand:- start:21402 stop:21839 length:438 start_codon:yes stop_codon:yes gene_type:complete
MKAYEKKLGRIFQLQFEKGDDFHPILNAFVKEKKIMAGTVFLMGALTQTEMISGFKTMDGYDVDRRSFDDWRELIALGFISWPEEPPPALLPHEIEDWESPSPYVHIHMALSGGPGNNEEVLCGHLNGGTIKGGMTLEIYEHLHI